MHELERTSLRIVKWTCEELLMKGVRRERYTGSMETTPTMMMRHTGCMTMMIMMMTRFMQCEPDSASKASKHLDVLLDNLQLDPNATNPLFRGQLLGTSSDYSSPGLASTLRSAARNEPPSRHQPLSAAGATPVAGYRSPKPCSSYAPSVTAASSSCRLKSAATVDVADGFCCFCHESSQ